jgi:hypothetical protein
MTFDPGPSLPMSSIGSRCGARVLEGPASQDSIFLFIKKIMKMNYE